MNFNAPDLSDLSRFFSGLVGDLRQKKLWPIAALLVVAIVAVPLLLSKSSHPAPVAQIPAPTPPPPAPTSLPALNVESTQPHSNLKGPAHDPFGNTTSAAPSSSTTTNPTTSVTTSAASAASSAATTTTAALTSSSNSSPPSSSSTPVQSGSPTITHRVTYFYDAVDLTFGKVGTRPKHYTNAARLHIFPSSSDPVVVYLGLERDAKTAVFLVDSRAAHVGAGTCRPNKASCAFLYLKVGKAEKFTVLGLDGKVRRYQLKVTKVHVVHVPSAAAAAKQANVHRAADGQKVASAAHDMAPSLPWPTFSSTTDAVSSPKAHRTRSAKQAAADQVRVILLSAHAAQRFLTALRAHHHAAALN